MLDQLIEWDTALLVFLNSFHADWLDPVVFMLSKTEAWFPLYAFLTFLIFRNFRKDGWLVLIGVVLTIVLADQVTSTIMKPAFHRLRPSQEPALEGVVHVVNGYRGGLFGFASSHAANTFGVAVLIFLLFKEIYRWMWLMFVWAMIVAYTRIYLGVHYPGDILAGATVGLLCGYAGFRFYLWLKSKRKPGLDPGS